MKERRSFFVLDALRRSRGDDIEYGMNLKRSDTGKKSNVRPLTDGNVSTDISTAFHNQFSTQGTQVKNDKIQSVHNLHQSSSGPKSPLKESNEVHQVSKATHNPALASISHERVPSEFSLGPYGDSAPDSSLGNHVHLDFAGCHVYPVNYSPSPRQLPSLPLPPQWSRHHDRAICFMDARSNCSLRSIVSNIKRSYPELAMARLTPGMVEKRLRVLDQNVNVNYWGVALSMELNEDSEIEEEETDGQESQNTGRQSI